MHVRWRPQFTRSLLTLFQRVLRASIQGVLGHHRLTDVKSARGIKPAQPVSRNWKGLCYIWLARTQHVTIPGKPRNRLRGLSRRRRSASPSTGSDAQNVSDSSATQNVISGRPPSIGGASALPFSHLTPPRLRYKEAPGYLHPPKTRRACFDEFQFPILPPPNINFAFTGCASGAWKLFL